MENLPETPDEWNAGCSKHVLGQLHHKKKKEPQPMAHKG